MHVCNIKIYGSSSHSFVLLLLSYIKYDTIEYIVEIKATLQAFLNAFSRNAIARPRLEKEREEEEEEDEGTAKVMGIMEQQGGKGGGKVGP